MAWRAWNGRTPSRPNDPAILRSLGIAHYKSNRLADARARLEQSVRLDPRDGAAALYLGLTAEKQGDISAAKNAYQTYVRFGRTSRVRRQLQARLAALTRMELSLAAKAAIAREQTLIAQAGAPRTIAVLPLRFVGQDTTLQPLERGLAELITIDLSRSSQLTVVERARMQALLDEIALQQSGRTDAATNVRAGKLIQAGRIVSGQIVQNASRLRVDAAIVNTQTAAVAGGAANENTLEQLFAIEKAVVFQLFDSLGVRLTTAERTAIEQRPTRSLQAFLAYSRGLQFEDQGKYEEAARQFGVAARLDPSFSQAQVKSAETQAAAEGSTMTAAIIETRVANTPESRVADQSAAGAAPPPRLATNSAGDIAGQLNPSQSAGATGVPVSGATGVTPPRDPLAAATGRETTARAATVTVIIRLPTPQ